VGSSRAARGLAGKSHKAVNGWAAFRVLLGSSHIGTLLELRARYEEREQGTDPGRSPIQGGRPSVGEADALLPRPPVS
jgi:hypothetical protein